MINISEIVSTWAVVDGWSISPGVPWCKEGYRINVGKSCKLGDYCTLGDYCNLGDNCMLGDYCRLGDYCGLGDCCKLGNNCMLGDYCRLGYKCSLGYGCTLGNICTLGPNATDPIDLGVTDGYRKCICNVGGVAYIGAGCRWFNLRAALKHWGSHTGDRRMSVAQMTYAKSIAELKGWSINEGDKS